jgi:hypothetical protein
MEAPFYHSIQPRLEAIQMFKTLPPSINPDDRPFMARNRALLIAELERMTDVEYAEGCGCNHHDAAGTCLGHETPEVF